MFLVIIRRGISQRTIYLLGSVNMDYSFETDEFPKIGETIKGYNYKTNIGGKGLNQLMATKMYNGKVIPLLSVGEDSDGYDVMSLLSKNNIDLNYVKKGPVETGKAFINISENNNKIITLANANNEIINDDVDKLLHSAKEGDIFITQLENNIETIRYALKLAKEKKMKIVLNPAPSCNNINDALCFVDYLIPNENEFSNLFGDKSYKEVEDEYSFNLIVTLGEKGCYYKGNIYPAKEVNVVDTVGAGDAFVGAFTAMISRDISIEESIDFALKAATASTLKRGTYEALMTSEEIRRRFD